MDVSDRMSAPAVTISTRTPIGEVARQMGPLLPPRPHGQRRRIRLQHGDIVTDDHAHLLAAIVELGGELEFPAIRNGRFRGAVIPEGCAVSAGRRRCGGRRPVR